MSEGNNQNNRNDNETEKQTQDQMRNSFTSTIAENSYYLFLFTRRFIKSKKKYQYYLYSSDEDFLFAVAALENDNLFTISMNANDISNSGWAAGSLRCSENGQFTGIYFNRSSKDDQYQNSIRINVSPSQKLLQVKIAPPGQPKFIFVEGNSEYTPITLNQIKDSINPNVMQFNLEHNGSSSFSFVQTHKDEFLVQSRYPLSIFQSFCICVAIVYAMA